MENPGKVLPMTRPQIFLAGAIIALATLGALPTTSLASIAVANPGFEADTAHWAAGTNTTLSRSTGTYDAHSGNAGLGIWTTWGYAHAINAHTTSFTSPVRRGRRYTVSAWLRSGGVPPMVGRLRCTNATGTKLFKQVSTFGALSTSWTKLSVTFTASRNSLRISIGAVAASQSDIAEGQGIAIDDVSITQRR